MDLFHRNVLKSHLRAAAAAQMKQLVQRSHVNNYMQSLEKQLWRYV